MIKRLFSYHRWLLVVLVLAAVLRLWQLGQIPPSPDWDEVALGYNAYSIWKTGRDEYGTFLPRVLRSFDDYKPPLYAYLAIPFIASFGLEVWAVRLPSAIAGILAVIGTYFLVLELYRPETLNPKHQILNKSKGSNAQNSKHLNFDIVSDLGFRNWDFQKLALTSAMLLALSPWHIQFSRIAFEANIAVTINIWAVATFLRGLRQKGFLYLSSFLFGLGLYAYHSERVFLPLLAITLGILYRRELLKDLKTLATVILVGFLTVSPLLPVIFDRANWTRLSGTSVLSDKTGLLMRSVKKLEEDISEGRELAGKIFENRRVVYTRTLLEGYLSHFSLRWLFLTGDNDRHHAPDMGLLYLVELPFIFWGLFTLWKVKTQASRLLVAWFFIAPIAASPTTELPHAIRTLVFLPTFQIFSAIGIMNAISGIKNSREVGSRYARQISNTHIKYQKFVGLGIFWIILIIFGVNIIYYLHMYFGHTHREYSQNWQYGYRESVEYAVANYEKYDKIVVSTKLEQPHMFFLFFLKYDPVKYLAEGGTASGGFAEVKNRFDKYEFRPIVWENEKRDGTILYLGTPREIYGTIDKFISYLDGSEAIRITD